MNATDIQIVIGIDTVFRILTQYTFFSMVKIGEMKNKILLGI